MNKYGKRKQTKAEQITKSKKNFHHQNSDDKLLSFASLKVKFSYLKLWLSTQSKKRKEKSQISRVIKYFIRTIN